MKQETLDFFNEKLDIFSLADMVTLAEKLILCEDECQRGVYLYQFAHGKTIDELVETVEELLENFDLCEAIVKRVDSKGRISRLKDRKTRTRRATQTTGLTKAKRRQIARKAAKTKRGDKGGQKRAQRKRGKAMSKRRSMGL